MKENAVSTGIPFDSAKGYGFLYVFFPDGLSVPPALRFFPPLRNYGGNPTGRRSTWTLACAGVTEHGLLDGVIELGLLERMTEPGLLERMTEFGLLPLWARITWHSITFLGD